MWDINDPSVYDDNYTVLSKIRKLIARIKKLEQKPDYTLPTATSSRLGGIKVGENLSVEEDGTLNAQAGGGGGGYTLPPATTSTLGGIIVGDNLSIDENGRLSGQAGGGGYTLPTATNTRLGGIKVGSRLSVQEDGTLSADDQSYTLPKASQSTLGGIKVGQNLTMDADGTLNATGGGGSSLTGDISIFKSTVATPILSDKFKRVTAAGTQYFNYADIYSIYDMITSTGTQINGFENVDDPTDTINLFINGMVQVPLYELKRIFKSGNAMVTDLSSDGSFYSFEIQEFSYGVSYVWTVTGSGVLNIEWDPSTGAMLSASIDFTINSVRNNDTHKMYVPSTGTQNHYNGTLDTSFGFSMKYVGYYVN